MKQLRRVSGVIVLAVLVFMAGCPQKDAELAVDEASLSIDPGADAGTITIRNTGGGKLEWSIDADVDWITFTENEGTDEAVVNALINRDALQALSMNSATITITSSGGTVQIPVVVASPVAALPPAYMPLEQGNIWRFGYGSPYKEAPANLLTSVLKAGGEDNAVMTWEVVGESSVNSLTVWQVLIAFPGMSIPTPVGVTVDNAIELDTWWVNVEGVWYIALDPAELDSLPNTDSLIPFVGLVKMPGKIMYLMYSDRLTTLLTDASDILNAATEAAGDYEAELAAFLDSVMVDEDEDGYAETLDLSPLFPILNAFGAEFDEYANENAILADGVELLADVASSVEPISLFVDAAEAIIEQAMDELDALPAPEDAEESLLALGESFGNEFDTYENADPLIESIVVTLAIAAKNDRVFADFGSTEEDSEAVETFYTDIVSFMFPYEEEFALKAAESLKALEPKAIAETIIGSYIGLEPEDVDELMEFVESYETENALVISHQAALLEVLTSARQIVVVLESYKLGDFRVTNLNGFSEALAAWAGEYLAAHADDTIAQGAAIIADAFDAVVEELLDLEPYIQEITGDIDQLMEDADNPTGAVFKLESYKKMLGDLAAFFESYADTTQAGDDALAAVLGIYLRAAESVTQLIVDLNAELDNAVYLETSGSLESLLPDWPYPMTLSDFGVGNQTDCLAAQITIPEPDYNKEAETEEHVVPIAIWSRNLGPVLFGSLPLQSASVDGVSYRR